MKKDERKQIEEELINSHKRWTQLYREGGNDPFWEDGVNLNLERNHILNYRRRLEELEYFPEIYYKEVPPEVDRKYMARKEEIRKHAEESLIRYKEDADYQYLVQNVSRVAKKKAEEICLGAVLGYVSGLQIAILNNDLITMRRHENPDFYRDSFNTCRIKMEKLIEAMYAEHLRLSEDRNGQLSFIW